MRTVAAIWDHMRGQTDARPLAVARVLVGLATLGNALETWSSLDRLLLPVVVKMPYLAGLPLLPRQALAPFVGLWLCLALLFTLGLFTRLSGALLAAMIGYVLLLDWQLYSNHLYLNALLVALLALADSGARWSLDARYRGRRDMVPRWPVLLLQAELSIVYAFAALTKINPAYLSGVVLAQFLPIDALPLVVVRALAILSILTEALLAVGLWFSWSRRYTLVLGIGFHLMIMLTGGPAPGIPDVRFTIFALLTVALYALFFHLPERRTRVETIRA
jgi:hypothetical protein